MINDVNGSSRTRHSVAIYEFLAQLLIELQRAQLVITAAVRRKKKERKKNLGCSEGASRTLDERHLLTARL